LRKGLHDLLSGVCGYSDANHLLDQHRQACVRTNENPQCLNN
jgi:hypothetical protein